MKEIKTRPHVLLLTVLFVLFGLTTFSQIHEPVKWSFSSKKLNAHEVELIFKASIEKNWYLYGMDIPEGGPIPTGIVFEAAPEKYKLIGKTKEPKGEVKYDPNFEMELKLFQKEAVFRQKVKILSKTPFEIKGYVEFMCCDNERCLPPTDIPFAIKVDGITTVDISANDLHEEDIHATDINDSLSVDIEEQQADIDKLTEVETTIPVKEKQGGILWIYIMGFLGGLLALVTPCVFPLIPMTVSFFLRSTKSRTKAISDALFFGVSIIVIYVLLGLGISVIFGANALNAMATSPVFNIFFFLLLILFAISFFGVFELQFPSKWTTALDSKADKTSGLVSVFFMAFTLVLVSFSCTGPIIGTLLVEAAVSGNTIAPLMGMAGFATALAIPFSLLAVFPSWLKSMPKSGGWLNAVKVVLAFLLLALSLKFLSTADMVAQWNLLTRPVYLALWIVIFSMMGLYLMGKLKFSHDSDMPYLSVPRLFMAIAVFSFVVYMLPGMFGAPLRAISSFLPPMTTQEFILGHTTTAPAVYNEQITGKNTKLGAHGLIKFLDYEEGLNYAKKENKPIFLDFTGLGCVNCKKMEADVWSDSRVLNMLRNDFVIISLYVDDRTTLPEDEQYISTLGSRERRIRTVGNKWSDFQAQHFGVNSQPYYVLLNHDGSKLIEEAFSYSTNIDTFIAFLEKGKKAFEHLNY